MVEKKDGWIDVGELMPQVSIQDIAAYYRFDLGELFGTEGEQRTRCPVLSCDGHNDFRSASVNVSDPKGPWKCHRSGYGCGAQGDKLTFIHCLEYGSMPSGKLTGKAFRNAAKTLLAIQSGEHPKEPVEKLKPNPRAKEKPKQPSIDDQPNIPLSQSENENIRRLANLDDQFIVDPSKMPPAARRYMQSREWMTPELMKQARCGYLPSSAKGTLRGMWVFGVMDENGEPLAWVGRNLKYKEKREEWEHNGRQGKEPTKYRFPSKAYFRRKFELYGQHDLGRPEIQEAIERIGLTVTEGFNDVLRLGTLGIPSVGIMSNRLTLCQVEAISRWSSDIRASRINVLFDANNQGDAGAKEAIWIFSRAGLTTNLIWHTGITQNREVETISPDEIEKYMLKS